MSLSDRAEIVLAAIIVAILVIAALTADYRDKHRALPAPAPTGVRP